MPIKPVCSHNRRPWERIRCAPATEVKSRRPRSRLMSSAGPNIWSNPLLAQVPILGLEGNRCTDGLVQHLLRLTRQSCAPHQDTNPPRHQNTNAYNLAAASGPTARLHCVLMSLASNLPNAREIEFTSSSISSMSGTIDMIPWSVRR